MNISRLLFHSLFSSVILLILILTGCKTTKDWNEVNSVVINMNDSLHFEESDFNEVLNDSLSVALDPKLFKEKLVNCKCEGTNYIAKGGYRDGIILFNDSTEMKVGLFVPFGLFKTYDTNETYSLTDKGMKANRWLGMTK